MQITAGVVGVNTIAGIVNLDRTLPGTDVTTIPLGKVPKNVVEGDTLNIRVSRSGKVSRASRSRKFRGNGSVGSALS